MLAAVAVDVLLPELAVQVEVHQQMVEMALGGLPQEVQEQLTRELAAAVEAILLVVITAVLASSSSRLTNKDIHAKQSLSILWN